MRKTRILLIPGILAMTVVLLLMWNPLLSANLWQSTDSVVAQVYLKKATEAEVVLTEINRYNLKPSQLIREYPMGDQAQTDGFYVEERDLADVQSLRDRYWQMYGGMLLDQQKGIELHSKEPRLDETEAAAWQRFTENIQRAIDDFATTDGCWMEQKCPGVEVSRLLVSGSKDSLQKFANDSALVDKIEVQDSNAKPDPTPTPAATQIAEPPNAEADSSTIQAADFNAVDAVWDWLPRSGSIDVNSSSLGGRYISHNIYWDTPNRVVGFAANSAYEHDFFLNDSSNSQYGPGTYLNDSETVDRIPVVLQWSSNLPSTYLDTRSGDSDYLKSFTIGSADGDAILSGTFYNSYIRAANGDATTDNGFLQGQLGYRVPSGCYSTWCVFGSEHINIYPTWQVDPLPGSVSWTLRELNEAIWRGNQGWTRTRQINANGAIDWFAAPMTWAGPIGYGSLPGSGDMQAQNNYRVGNNLIQGYWRGNEGRSRTVPISNGVIQWAQAGPWSAAIAISSLPGSGDMQAQGDYAVTSTLVQGFWRSNQGWTRNVPIVNGVIQWGQAGAWAGPISISGLPGSGDMQAQDNYVIGNIYWQIIWRNNQQYTRSVPIVNGAIQWGQASGWSTTTAQETLPGSGTVQTQAGFVFP